MNPSKTIKVLYEVLDERTKQFARYGDNDDLEDGTGPDLAWLGPEVDPQLRYRAGTLEMVFRHDYETHEALTGKPTWMHLVREEIAEAFKESDPVRLREELVQVAALAVSWIEKIDAR